MRLSVALCTLACLLAAGRTLAWSDVEWQAPGYYNYEIVAQNDGYTWAKLTNKHDWQDLSGYVLNRLDNGEPHKEKQCAKLECLVETCVVIRPGELADQLHVRASQMLFHNYAWMDAPESVSVAAYHGDTYAGNDWPDQAPWKGKATCGDGMVNYKVRVYVDRDTFNVEKKWFDLEGQSKRPGEVHGSWLGRCAPNRKVRCHGK